ncbi:hypothetical protein SAMN04487759_14811 [Kandleria vitulina]|uniref:Uncharacterized protein n=1 Tax=Kandleria vitulina TaxID=1630 RepID=A0A1H2W7N1_9FIRM|nr:hypothetical protein [Kandleria vitulina]SDW76551.1 hypothetical protein SAMN04487759_14811 [Kandleria vitulina]
MMNCDLSISIEHDGNVHMHYYPMNISIITHYVYQMLLLILNNEEDLSLLDDTRLCSRLRMAFLAFDLSFYYDTYHSFSHCSLLKMFDYNHKDISIHLMGQSDCYKIETPTSLSVGDFVLMIAVILSVLPNTLRQSLFQALMEDVYGKNNETHAAYC